MSKKKHGFNWLICKKLKASLGMVEDVLDTLTYEEIIRSLVAEADWTTILECFATLADEYGFQVKVFRNGKQIYPWTEEE